MPTTQEIFESKKDLRNWWARVIDDPRYAEVLLHARSMLLESVQGEAAINGARVYENILTSIASAPPTEAEMPNPGLLHNVDQIPTPPVAEPAPAPKEDPKPKRKTKDK